MPSYCFRPMAFEGTSKAISQYAGEPSEQHRHIDDAGVP